MPSYNAFVCERHDIEEVQKDVEACGATVTRTLSAAGVIQFESSVETADAVRKLTKVGSVISVARLSAWRKAEVSLPYWTRTA